MKDMKAMKTKSRQSRQSKQDRYANLMIAVAVIAGVYFVVWALIGLAL
jgi:methionine-rich copper-binding protein CopC